MRLPATNTLKRNWEIEDIATLNKTGILLLRRKQIVDMGE